MSLVCKNKGQEQFSIFVRVLGKQTGQPFGYVKSGYFFTTEELTMQVLKGASCQGRERREGGGLGFEGVEGILLIP